MFGKFRRAKSRSVLVRFSAHWGLMPFKFESSYILTHTAWCLPTCLVRRWSYKCAQQLPSCHGFAGVGGVRTAQNLFNFCPCRPQWAEARRTQGLVFGAAGRKCPSSRRAPPVKWGSGGNDCEHRRRQGAHRKRPPGHFWFLFGQAKRNKVAPIKHHQSKPEKLRENGQNFLKKHLDTHGGVDVSYWSPC